MAKLQVPVEHVFLLFFLDLFCIGIQILRIHSDLQNMRSTWVPSTQYALECLLSSRQGLSKGKD